MIFDGTYYQSARRLVVMFLSNISDKASAGYVVAQGADISFVKFVQTVIKSLHVLLACLK